MGEGRCTARHYAEREYQLDLYSVLLFGDWGIAQNRGKKMVKVRGDRGQQKNMAH